MPSKIRAMAALLACIGGSVLAATYNLNAPLTPDPVKTPGDVLTSDPKIICKSGYTQTVRNVPQSLKNQVYKNYGITSRAAGEFEVDHLISLELGGSNSIKNLWPESYKTMPLNAHIKDKIENKLHALACAGTITFTDAQQMIAHDWEGAYTRYIGPLPGGVVPSTVGPNTVPVLPASTPNTATSSASFPPNSDGSCPAAAPIKVSKAGIYHMPEGDGSYARTHAQSCFATPAAAQAAGFRAPLN